jgi:hypothetical protein
MSTALGDHSDLGRVGTIFKFWELYTLEVASPKSWLRDVQSLSDFRLIFFLSVSKSWAKVGEMQLQKGF